LGKQPDVGSEMLGVMAKLKLVLEAYRVRELALVKRVK